MQSAEVQRKSQVLRSGPKKELSSKQGLFGIIHLPQATVPSCPTARPSWSAWTTAQRKHENEAMLQNHRRCSEAVAARPLDDNPRQGGLEPETLAERARQLLTKASEAPPRMTVSSRKPDAEEPKVLLGRVQGIMQRRDGHIFTKKDDLRACPTPVEESSNQKASKSFPSDASDTSTALPSSRVTPTPPGTRGSSRCTARSTPTPKSAGTGIQESSSTRATETSKIEVDEGTLQTPRPRSPLPPLTAFTRLRTRPLAQLPKSPHMTGLSNDIAGHGLLWPGTFSRYAIGVMPGSSSTGACLGFAEFGRLLREHGVDLDYQGRCRAIELASGKGAQSLDFEAFLNLIEKTARQAAYVSSAEQEHHKEMRKAEPWRSARDQLQSQQLQKRAQARKAKKPDEVALAVARAVFNSYASDSLCSIMDRVDYMRLLRDRGQVPKSAEETKELALQLALCREDGLPGPLNFIEFLRLLVNLSINNGHNELLD